MAGMSEITWLFVALMAVIVAGQAFVVWLASR
jgi:HAMP domain-containing protein